MTSDELQEFTKWLWHEIAITQAMDIRALSRDEVSLTVSASLDANFNHKQTAFGGSISATLTVACWGLLHLVLKESGSESTIVIQEIRTGRSISNSKKYLTSLSNIFCF